MAISEARRRDLYNSLDELLGTELAETLMAYLPAYESTELATKEDIRRLEDRFDRIDNRFGQVDDRFGQVEDQFKQVDDRFDRIEHRFKQVDDRFDRIEDRLDAVNQRLDRFFLTQSAGLIAIVGTLIAAVLL
jgi:septal ring factor EnvC (AmiA/AmiB activator)